MPNLELPQSITLSELRQKTHIRRMHAVCFYELLRASWVVARACVPRPCKDSFHDRFKLLRSCVGVSLRDALRSYHIVLEDVYSQIMRPPRLDGCACAVACACVLHPCKHNLQNAFENVLTLCRGLPVGCFSFVLKKVSGKTLRSCLMRCMQASFMKMKTSHALWTCFRRATR